MQTFTPDFQELFAEPNQSADPEGDGVAEEVIINIVALTLKRMALQKR